MIGLSSCQCSVNKNVKFKASMLISDICDYNNTYIVAKGTMTVIDSNGNNRINKKVALKNNAPFISCIAKINNILIDNAEDLDIVMPMYNLLGYSENCSVTSGSCWNCYRDEINDDKNETNWLRNRINNNKAIRSKSFQCNTKLEEACQTIMIQ